MATYAVIRAEVVENVIEWDADTDWAPPEGCTVQLVEEGSSAGPGWTYVDGVYYPPVDITTTE